MKIKTSIVTGLALAAVGGAYAAETVGTSEIASEPVAISKKAGATADTAVGVPWTGMTGTAVKASELIATGLDDGDVLSVWNATSKKYDVWVYNGSAWETSTHIATKNGKQIETTTTAAAADITIPRGSAVWFKKTSTKAYTLVGKTAESCETTVVSGSKQSLYCNPFSVAVPLSSITGAANDQILTLNTKTLYTHNGTAWCTGAWEEKTVFGQTQRDYVLSPVAEGTAIPAGEGFWFTSKNGGTITWPTTAE